MFLMSSNCTLMEWLPEKHNEVVNVYLLYYSIPSEDGICFVERTIDRELKIKCKVIPSEIRNRIKSLRFKFYDILKQYGIVKTEVGRLVKAEDVAALKASLYS
ncbi:MAG: hypothetical protein DRN04_18645, partial [Thermoprotei archaeon]